MNKVFIRLISFTLFLTLILSITSCSRKMVEKVDVFEDDYFVTDHYTNGFDGITDITYERKVIEIQSFGRNVGFGPTEPTYRGVIHITSERAMELNENYTWEEVDNPVFNAQEIDVSGLTDRTWYMCSDFNKDTFQAISVTRLYFDGVDSFYFELQVT